MSIIRFDPFRDPFRDLDRLTSQLVSGTRTPPPMPMDAWRSADGFHVALDLPGVDRIHRADGRTQFPDRAGHPAGHVRPRRPSPDGRTTAG